VATCVSGSDKVNVVVYVYDFLITGKYWELIENKVMPDVENFLKMRGLELSDEKIRITHVENDFRFQCTKV
jgi:RNA-directed DNA polymerase